MTRLVVRALTIAGSDSSGGAGVQADLKVFASFGAYGMAVVTAVTAQNTTGVHGRWDVPPEVVGLQLDSVLGDIGADAVKTGMLANTETVGVVSRKISEYEVSRLVVDPVMAATGGAELLSAEGRIALGRNLLPLAFLVTPNLEEAAVITGLAVADVDGMKEAARKLVDLGARNALVKGGHLEGEAVDVLFDGCRFTEFRSERIPSSHTHGSGCTFSAAITAALATGQDLEGAVAAGKEFVTGAIRQSLALGAGSGPVNHLFWRRRQPADPGKETWRSTTPYS